MITTQKSPKKPKAKEQLGVKLDPELYAKLEAIGLAEERPLAQLARIAIREFVERKSAVAA